MAKKLAALLPKVDRPTLSKDAEPVKLEVFDGNYLQKYVLIEIPVKFQYFYLEFHYTYICLSQMKIFKEH